MLRQRDIIERLREIAREGAVWQSASVGNGQVSVELDLLDCDRYSAVVAEVRARGSFTDVPAAAHALVTDLDELRERLALLEYDAGDELALLRSAEPLREPEAVEYWEAELRPGTLRLARYRKEHAAADRVRQPVPLLHRSLASLVEQISSALVNPR